MRTVDVRVRHDDDLVVAEFVGVEFLAANARAQAVISVPISWLESILSKRARSTFRILPRRGNTA